MQLRGDEWIRSAGILTAKKIHSSGGGNSGQARTSSSSNQQQQKQQKEENNNNNVENKKDLFTNPQDAETAKKIIRRQV